VSCYKFLLSVPLIVFCLMAGSCREPYRILYIIDNISEEEVSVHLTKDINSAPDLFTITANSRAQIDVDLGDGDVEMRLDEIEGINFLDIQIFNSDSLPYVPDELSIFSWEKVVSPNGSNDGQVILFVKAEDF